MKLQFLKSELDEYIQECGFTDREETVLLYKRRGFSVSSSTYEQSYTKILIYV